MAKPGVVLDLNQHAPRLENPAVFEPAASAMMRRGGEVAIVALAEHSRLEQLGPGVAPALESEVLEMLGRHAGAGAILCRPLSGVIACASPSALDAVTRDVSAQWRALGAIRGENIEVERTLSVEIVRASDGIDLARRAKELAAGPTARIESLPVPLAIHLRSLLGAPGFREATSAFVHLVRNTIRFLSAVVMSMLDPASRPGSIPSNDGPREWLEPWYSRSIQAVRALTNIPERPAALVAAWFDSRGNLRTSFENAIELASVLHTAMLRRPIDIARLHREESKVRPLVDALLADLAALHGWTLVAVVRSDVRDALSQTFTVMYVDYTGSFALGTPRRLNVLTDERLGPYVYLTRFVEGIHLPLDPSARRRQCPTCGVDELFWSDELVTSPGRYRYHSVARGHAIDNDVHVRDIPHALRGPS